MQNFKTIGQLRNELGTNEISRDLSFRWVYIQYCNSPWIHDRSLAACFKKVGCSTYIMDVMPLLSSQSLFLYYFSSEGNTCDSFSLQVTRAIIYVHSWNVEWSPNWDMLYQLMVVVEINYNTTLETASVSFCISSLRFSGPDFRQVETFSVSKNTLTLSQEHPFVCRKWMLLPVRS